MPLLGLDFELYSVQTLTTSPFSSDGSFYSVKINQETKYYN